MPPTKISLIVQPGDSFFPIVNAIDRAETSLNITVFRMDDPIIQTALLEAHHRGVRVRTLIATSARGWEEKNRRLLKDIKKAGIEIREPTADSKKMRFHYKLLMVDGRQSFVFTFNPTRENLHYTRDFGVAMYDERVAAELNRLFDADWTDSTFKPEPKSPVLVSPYNSRRKMEEFLKGATKSIHIWDAKLSDKAIVDLVRSKAAQGVEVRVLGEGVKGAPSQDGIQHRVIDRFKLHAKCVVVDGERAVLGSMNLRTESLDIRREVSIFVEDATTVRKLESVFASDWEQKPMPSSSARTVIKGAEVANDAPEELEPGFTLISRTDALRRHTLGEGLTTIGRSDDSDIVVEHPLASRNHARLTVSHGRCSLTDLGSANGTFVNGARIEGTVTLARGDVVSVGDAEEFRFVEI